MIHFKDTEAERAGKNIQLLREWRGLTREQFAEECDLNPEFLWELEEGRKDEVSEAVAERVLVAGGVCKRGNKYSSDELKKTLLCISRRNPPELFSLLGDE